MIFYFFEERGNCEEEKTGREREKKLQEQLEEILPCMYVSWYVCRYHTVEVKIYV
jgi:hypothetical protein